MISGGVPASNLVTKLSGMISGNYYVDL